MIPHSIVIDQFLPDFDDWRAWADKQVYAPVANPIDGVEYPGICHSVPTWGMSQRLAGIFGQAVKIRCAFMRLSLAGVHVPHQTQNDTVIGQYTVIVYLNRAEHCQGGTALVRHISGDDLAHWDTDHSKPEMWEAYSLCEMKPNRAFIFRSELFHRTQPVNGFGSSTHDGLLVLTCFADVQ